VAEYPYHVPLLRTGSSACSIFGKAIRMLSNRISAFISPPIASLDRLNLKNRLDQTGKL
jgi:hypothetical protein